MPPGDDGHEKQQFLSCISRQSLAVSNEAVPLETPIWNASTGCFIQYCSPANERSLVRGNLVDERRRLEEVKPNRGFLNIDWICAEGEWLLSSKPTGCCVSRRLWNEAWRRVRSLRDSLGVIGRGGCILETRAFQLRASVAFMLSPASCYPSRFCDRVSMEIAACCHHTLRLNSSNNSCQVGHDDSKRLQDDVRGHSMILS